MRIAVIGASGMLGRHAAGAALSAGHHVIACGRSLKSLEPLHRDRVALRLADLDNRASLTVALDGADAVINCAGYYPTVPRPWRAEVSHALGQMEAFYAACAGLPLDKIVYLGAAIALPKTSNGAPATELADYPSEPADKTPYLQVKWALDRQARAKAAQGLPVVIGIPTMSIGEFDIGRSTGRLVLEMARGTLPGYIEGRRNVIYAGDAGRGLVRCAEAGEAGQRYLLAGENLSMTELMTNVAHVTGSLCPSACRWRARSSPARSSPCATGCCGAQTRPLAPARSL